MAKTEAQRGCKIQIKPEILLGLELLWPKLGPNWTFYDFLDKKLVIEIATVELS